MARVVRKSGLLASAYASGEGVMGDGQAHEASAPWLLLRLLVGCQFIAAGAFSLLRWDATVAFNALLTGPSLAPAATALAIGLTIGGGLSVATGWRARLGALLLIAFLVPATVRHVLAAGHASELLSGLATQSAAAVDLADLARRGQLAAVAKNIALLAVATFIALRGVRPTS